MDCGEYLKKIERLEAQIAFWEDDPGTLPTKDRDIFLARLRDRREAAQEALRNCEAGLPEPGIHAARGRVAFLRVHGDGRFGPEHDRLHGDVAFRLDTYPGRTFGFALEDEHRDPGARRGMLDLLREAFTYQHEVRIQYRQELNRFNSTACRIELHQDPLTVEFALNP